MPCLSLAEIFFRTHIYDGAFNTFMGNGTNEHNLPDNWNIMFENKLQHKNYLSGIRTLPNHRCRRTMLRIFWFWHHQKFGVMKRKFTADYIAGDAHRTRLSSRRPR
jgi:hypothetical protein